MQKLKAYQKFPVDLFDISRIFNLIGSGITEKKDQLAQTGFGDNKVRGLKEYLTDFDLLGEKNSLTPLGEIIYHYDPRFREPFTRWLLIYHWSLKVNNPYLFFLINHGAGVYGEDRMIDKFRSWAEKNDVKTDYEGDMLRAMIRNTDSAFLEGAAFLNLNLFVEESGVVERSEPYMVEPLLIAYIIYYNRNKRTSIGFAELLREESNAAKFFNFDFKRLDHYIVELNNIGLTRLIQYADLHMIEYTYDGHPLKLVEKYYHEH